MSETKQQEATTGSTPEAEVSAMTPSTDAPAVSESEATVPGAATGATDGRGRGARSQGANDRRNQRRPRRGGRPERVRPEFDQKIISIRRGTRVMAGGRPFSFSVSMNKEGHIPHDVHTKYASSEVMMMPAPGRGLVAGSSVRTVLEHAGVKDVTAKIFSRSKNKLNNARAAVEALKQLKKN